MTLQQIFLTRLFQEMADSSELLALDIALAECSCPVVQAKAKENGDGSNFGLGMGPKTRSRATFEDGFLVMENAFTCDGATYDPANAFVKSFRIELTSIKGVIDARDKTKWAVRFDEV